MILLVWNASEPPLKITAFPDLKQRLATSDVTFGLLSYITAIIPIGTVTFFIVSPFGLFHFSRILFVGSFNLII